MRITVTLQLRSKRLTLDDLGNILGYPAGHLVAKGEDRIPARAVPKANLWNVSVVVANQPDINYAIAACLENYPEISERIRMLRQADPDAACIMYLGLRPFTRDFILLLEAETIRRLADMLCELSIEYFDES